VGRTSAEGERQLGNLERLLGQPALGLLLAEAVEVLVSYLKEHDDHISLYGHYSNDVLYISTFLGSVMVEICDRCGYLVPRCEHQHNSWNPEGTILSCNLCGADGT
jgi:hypothetical protein